MNKVYIESKHSDKEVEEAIYNMDKDRLRIVLYGIARGWGFDESMDIALFIGKEKELSWV